MSVQLATIANSIAGMTVSGLTIKDIDEIPTTINQRDLPLLIPEPDKYISVPKIEVDSFGTGSNRKMTLAYNLNYMLIYGLIGAGRINILDSYAGMLAKACAFLDAIYVLDGLTGAVDFNAVIGDPVIRTIGDLDYHSIDIQVNVKEFIN